jgi:hypothetical protein
MAAEARPRVVRIVSENHDSGIPKYSVELARVGCVYIPKEIVFDNFVSGGLYKVGEQSTDTYTDPSIFIIEPVSERGQHGKNCLLVPEN